MARKYGLAEVKRKNKASGSDFFSPKTMRFFGRADYSTVLEDGDTYVVVEKEDGNTSRYKFDPKTGKLQYSS